jgi:EAL domain-containing protein (putative c-di-GMP-specific phosphodiesterase class I)
MDLEAGLLKVYYQPQISASGDYCGAEALLRWEHPVAGFVYPPLIVGLARENGFLDELEDFVFSSAARVIRKLEKGGEFEPKVSVNITGTSMAYSGFEDMIDRVVENAGIRREHLWIEITEQESIASTRELTRLRNKGHKLLIDDFGMGHTSIYYLETGLFDVVKLDGSVTCKIMTDDSVHAIVDSVIRLSHRLGMTVVAEFVETEVQQDILCTMGCDVYQGSLYSGPVPEEEFFDSLYELAHKGMCPCQYARMKEAE